MLHAYYRNNVLFLNKGTIVKRYPHDVPLPNKLIVANKLDLFQTWKQDKISIDENN